MTDYIRKMPGAAGVLFFAVAGFFSLLSGSDLLTALFRASIAGAVAALFIAPLAYVLFEEKIPEPEAPEGLEHLNDKFKRKKS